jgi:DNA-binding beta-propeller fold protein YncE
VSDIDNERVSYYGLDGSFQGSWGSYGAAPGQFYGCEGIAHDNAGNVFVCDTGNNRMQKFTSTGSLLSVFGMQGQALGQLYTPSDVALDPSGVIFIAEWNNARIQRWEYGEPTPARRTTWGALKVTYR